MNKCCVPGCQPNYKKRDVEYKYVLRFVIFSFPKKDDLRNEWKRKIPRDNLIVTQYLVFLRRKISEMNGKGNTTG